MRFSQGSTVAPSHSMTSGSLGRGPIERSGVRHHAVVTGDLANRLRRGVGQATSTSVHVNQIEGNSYSRAETINLLKLAECADARESRDAYALILTDTAAIVEPGMKGSRNVPVFFVGCELSALLTSLIATTGASSPLRVASPFDGASLLCLS